MNNLFSKDTTSCKDTSCKDTTCKDTSCTTPTPVNKNNNIENTFKLPISYLTKNLYDTPVHLLTDLELLHPTKSLYQKVFPSSSSISKISSSFATDYIPLFATQYTTDTTFLKDTQRLIIENGLAPLADDQYQKIMPMWYEMKQETSFMERYEHYINYSWLKKYNTNATFLQLLSIYNMTSPILSLLVPIVFLFLPFLILKVQGITITMDKYVMVIQTLFKRHQLGQLFNLKTASYDKVVYIVITIGFYIMQIYQNIMSCKKFYTNMHKIHADLFVTRQYLQMTMKRMETVRPLLSTLPTYSAFLSQFDKMNSQITGMVTDLDSVSPAILNFAKLKQIGYVMKCFYKLNNDAQWQEGLHYTFGLHGYLDNIIKLKTKLTAGEMAKCNYVTNDDMNKDDEKKRKSKKDKGNKKKVANVREKTKFTNAYFPLDEKQEMVVKNSYDLNKHAVITGPNAAGKTTLLKATLYNILLSQQIGCGFYEAADLVPFDQLHCYINIPDTSERDSLFQAEARRCKDILTRVDDGQRHFCIFDELYSGTNPYEAIGSAYAFLNYLTKYDKVTFMLTTHFLDLCYKLENVISIKNYHMLIEGTDEEFTYTYKIKKGISHIKGGVKVLKDLAYPPELIRQAINVIGGMSDSNRDLHKN